MNTLTARRCIGNKDEKRCDHWFEFKECPGCGTKNDIVSRQCRSCQIELIDPNRNLHDVASNKNKILLQIKETQYSLTTVNGSPRFDIRYLLDMRSNPTQFKMVNESFLLSTEKSVRFFYHTIAKLHFMHPHQAYSQLQNIQFLKSVIENDELHSPKSIECIEIEGRLKVVAKHFNHTIVEQDLRQLDVLYTFINFCKLKNTATLEYLVRENESFSLIKDNYRLNTPTSYKRFAKNYGSVIASHIEGVTGNQYEILTPRKIWVDVNNRMQKFVEDAPKVSSEERRTFMLDRTNLSVAFEKWCEIIKFEVCNNRIAYDRNNKFFKVFYVKIIAHVTFNNRYGEKYEKLINVSCKIAEVDLDRLQSKQYRYLMPMADGRWTEDIEQWQTVEGKVFLKHDCINYRE